MGQNSTSQIHVKSEHIFSGIGLYLPRHGLDHKLRQKITNTPNIYIEKSNEMCMLLS